MVELTLTFNEHILAAKMMKSGEYEFVTWLLDYDRNGVTTGYYFGSNFDDAKQEFAMRAGMIDSSLVFTKEKLASIYDACVFRGRNDSDITYEDEKLLRDVLEQVEENLPEAVKYEQEHSLELEQEQ